MIYVIVPVDEPPSSDYDLPPRQWENGVNVPGRPQHMIPGLVWREGLWTVVRNADDGEVVRIWDAPNPALMT